MQAQKHFTAFLMALLICTLGIAQNSINYKALIKDGSGNVVANDLIQVQFSILQGVGLTNVYSETHSPTTDASGLIILNIGEGTPISGLFTDVDWASDTHFLNVQIDTGSGLVDLGTTEFKTVPYALQAETATTASNVTGLETLDEGNGIGWRLVGQNPDNYNNIGLNAVDLSYSAIFSTIFGATGSYSTAMGRSTTASGPSATAMGESTIASGQGSTAMGILTTASNFASTAMGVFTTASGPSATAMGVSTTASGIYSTAMGNNTTASSYNSTTIGRYNIGGGNATTWVETNKLFEIGNGTSSTTRSNAFTVLKNGHIGIGAATPAVQLQIDGGGDASLSNGSGYLVIGNENSSNIVMDNNEIMARDTGGTSTLFLQHNGGDVWAGGSFVHSSDRRLKKDIINLPYGLKDILQLQPKAYNWKNREQKHKSFGLIAQDVQSIIKEIIHIGEDENKTLSISYTELIPVLIKAMQEQQVIIMNSEFRIQNYENEVNGLKNRLTKIEALLINNKEEVVINNKK